MGCVLIPVKQSALYVVNVISSLDRNGFYGLKNYDHIKYLGVNLSYVKPMIHFGNHIKSCRNAYYALQCIG